VRRNSVEEEERLARCCGSKAEDISQSTMPNLGGNNPWSGGAMNFTEELAGDSNMGGSVSAREKMEWTRAARNGKLPLSPDIYIHDS
jgi:hypothetical protein